MGGCIEAQHDVARYESSLLLAKTELAFYRKALRQLHVAKLSAAHGLRVTLSDPEDPDPLAGVGAAVAPTGPKACKVRQPSNKHTADGQCRACCNLSRGVAQQVGHLDGPPCKRQRTKPGRPQLQNPARTTDAAVAAAAAGAAAAAAGAAGAEAASPGEFSAAALQA